MESILDIQDQEDRESQLSHLLDKRLVLDDVLDASGKPMYKKCIRACINYELAVNCNVLNHVEPPVRRHRLVEVPMPKRGEKESVEAGARQSTTVLADKTNDPAPREFPEYFELESENGTICGWVYGEQGGTAALPVLQKRADKTPWTRSHCWRSGVLQESRVQSIQWKDRLPL